MDLPIDRMGRDAERAPAAPVLPRFGLTNAEAWVLSGGVASWLIARGFGPGTLSIAVPAADSFERVVLLLGALRAGVLVVEGAAAADLAFTMKEGSLVSPAGIAFAALARCPVDAAVAERRLHIRADTPARMVGGTCRRHGDFATIAEAISG